MEAFAKLVRAHSSLVYKVSLRMLGNEYAHLWWEAPWKRRAMALFRSSWSSETITRTPESPLHFKDRKSSW